MPDGRVAFDGGGEDVSADHGVPADMIELHEIMEWEAAVAKIGLDPNGPTQ